MDDLSRNYPEYQNMDYDELKHRYSRLDSRHDLLEEQYLKKQMPDEVRINFIQSRLDRIEDSNSEKHQITIN